MTAPPPLPPPSPDAAASFLGAVGRVMARITTGADRQGVLDALAAGPVADLGVDLVRIWLYDPADDALHLRARASCTGLVPDSVARLTLRDLQAPIVRAIQRRGPLVVDRIRLEDGIPGTDAMLREGLRAYAGFPLMVADRLCGGLSLFRRAPFPPPLLEAVGVLAQQAALALEHARLLEESHNLQAIAAELASARDMRALLEGIVERTMAALATDGCVVWLVDERDGVLTSVAARGVSAEFFARMSSYNATQGNPRFEEMRDTRRPVYMRDAHTSIRARDPRRAATVAAEGIISVLMLPLFMPGGAIAGILVLYHRRERVYSQDEIRLAQAFTDQVAVALHNARLTENEREARENAARLAEEERAAREAAARLAEQERAAREAADRQLERLTTLAAITQQLLAAGELDAVLRVVVESASRLCDASGAMVSLIDDSTRQARVVAAHGLPAVTVARLGADKPRALDGTFFSGSATEAALRQGKAVAIEDYAAWPASGARDASLGDGVRALILAPLRVRDVPIGALSVTDRRWRRFTPEDVALVEALADQAALAIEQARLLQRSREAAGLEERARLARDLHDSVTQTVAGLGMLAQAAQVQHARGLPALSGTLERIGTLAKEALAETRALLFELRPAALAEEGLAGALAKLVAAVQVRVDLPISYAGTATTRLSPETELAIFRIVQEALANACKYARATAITVTVAEADGQLTVTVADDGVGFDPAAPVAPSADARWGGMGLRAMRERAAAAGLALRVDSAAGFGTRISVAAPLP